MEASTEVTSTEASVKASTEATPTETSTEAFVEINLQGYVLLGLWIPGKGMGVLKNLQKFRVRV